MAEYLHVFPLQQEVKVQEELRSLAVHQSQWGKIVDWARENNLTWSNDKIPFKKRDDSFQEGPWTFLYFEIDKESGTISLSREGRGHKTCGHLLEGV